MWHCKEVVEEPGVPGSDFSEDRLGSAGPMAWVIDGASAVTGQRVTDDRHSDASWLAGRLDRAMAALAVESGLSLAEIVAEAIARTARQAEDEWLGVPDVPPSAALGVVRQAGERTGYLVLADVSVLLQTTDGRVRAVTDSRVEAVTEHARRRMVARLEEGASLQEARREVNPVLAGARAAMNSEGGYWVASLDEHAVDHAVTGEVAGVREVVLATDGFMRVVEPFGLITTDELFEPGCSLGDLARRVRRAEQDDPETRQFARWSVSDDLSATRLRWVGRAPSHRRNGA
jgi:hypothetical protein